MVSLSLLTSLLTSENGKLISSSAGNKEQEFADDHAAGKYLLKSSNKIVNDLEVTMDEVENSKRTVVLLKTLPAYKIYEELVIYYGTLQLLSFIKEKKIASLDELRAALPSKNTRNEWMNVGGQLIPSDDVALLKEKIKTGKIKSWDAIHEYYTTQGEKYPQQKFKHALASLAEITGINLKKIDTHQFANLLNGAVATKEWITKGIKDSRAKDYTNPYRKMVYESVGEMNEVLGKLEDNGFINEQIEELKKFKTEMNALKKKFKLTLSRPVS